MVGPDGRDDLVHDARGAVHVGDLDALLAALVDRLQLKDVRLDMLLLRVVHHLAVGIDARTEEGIDLAVDHVALLLELLLCAALDLIDLALDLGQRLERRSGSSVSNSDQLREGIDRRVRW